MIVEAIVTYFSAIVTYRYFFLLFYHLKANNFVYKLVSLIRSIVIALDH